MGIVNFGFIGFVWETGRSSGHLVGEKQALGHGQ
jgi:hypothetical protein